MRSQADIIKDVAESHQRAVEQSQRDLQKQFNALFSTSKKNKDEFSAAMERAEKNQRDAEVMLFRTQQSIRPPTHIATQLINLRQEQLNLNSRLSQLEERIEERKNKVSNEVRTKMEGVLQESRDTNTTEGKSSPPAETHSSSTMNISMMVLGGFIAAAGIAAVAIAFIVLNAATFGTPGLVVAGIGVAAALSGVGLFATGAYENKSTTSDISLRSLKQYSICPYGY